MKAKLHSILESVGEYAASSYIAGAHIEDALNACRSLHAQNFKSTPCFWDGDNDRAETIVSNYNATIHGVGLLNSDSYVSVKPWPLQHSTELFRHFSLEAKSRGIKLHYDSASAEDQEKTIRLIRELLPIGCKFGYTLPGRWQRSVADAELAHELGLDVRVVKGQWADPLQDVDPSDGYMRVIERLAGRAPHVGVATHHPRLAHKALSTLLEHGTSCELELLYGLPVRAVLPVAKKLGVPVRVYLPYGHAWLPYAVGRLRKQPQMIFWLMRDMASALRMRIAGNDQASRLPI